VEVAPRDVFPPAAPAGLTGLYTSNAVELLWSPNTEPDLAGYNIYRGGAGEQPAKLNSALLPSPLYHDTSIAAGRRYTYHVTAVDLKGNESAPSQDVSVDVP
jgi:fibronectin type 3 domain-containing protein